MGDGHADIETLVQDSSLLICNLSHWVIDRLRHGTVRAKSAQHDCTVP